jgi:hypothetical protein
LRASKALFAEALSSVWDAAPETAPTASRVQLPERSAAKEASAPRHCEVQQFASLSPANATTRGAFAVTCSSKKLVETSGVFAQSTLFVKIECSAPTQASKDREQRQRDTQSSGLIVFHAAELAGRVKKNRWECIS